MTRKERARAKRIAELEEYQLENGTTQQTIDDYYWGKLVVRTLFWKYLVMALTMALIITFCAK